MPLGCGRPNSFGTKRSTAFDRFGALGRLDAQAHRDTIAWLREMKIGTQANPFLNSCEQCLDDEGQLTRRMQVVLERLQDEMIRRLRTPNTETDGR